MNLLKILAILHPLNVEVISIKYDKDLQKDIATRKGISTDDVKDKMSRKTI